MSPNVAWAIGVGLLLLYEGYALWNKTPGDTLSEAIWRLSRRPFLPFVVGVLCGHFFWQAQDCLEAMWK